jgi:hypothetical protein
MKPKEIEEFDEMMASFENRLIDLTAVVGNLNKTVHSLILVTAKIAQDAKESEQNMMERSV